VVSNSHATSYAYLTAATVYLKARYPAMFYLNMLRLAREEPNAVEYMKAILNEMRQYTAIQILPPDILRSSADFTLEKDPNDATLTHIRFGLGHVRGISDSTMEKLASFQRQTFTSKLDVFGAAKAAGINIGVLSSLIYSGCLNWKGQSRLKLALEAQTYNLLTDNQKAKVRQFAAEYDEDIVETLRALPTKVNEKGKPIIPESQLETLRRKYAPYWDAYLHHSRNEELANYLHERHLLGFSYTSSLWKVFSKKVVGLLELSEVAKRGKEYGARNAALPKDVKPPRAEAVTFVAFLDEIKVCSSQKDGTPYAKLTLSDDSGAVRALLYGPERLDACKRANGDELPKEGSVVSCEGSFAKEGSLIFVDTLLVQDNHLKAKPVEGEVEV
jgi:DNA polymerase III alpha subunit